MADRRRGRLVSLTSRRVGPKSTGNPPTGKLVRSAKLAALPVAYAGRRAAGTGKRILGLRAGRNLSDIELRTAEHMFDVLGELKGCAQKLGQLLAIYEMALPPDLAEPYRIALSRLQDSGPALLPSTVHAAMAANMGENWAENFRSFDDRRPAAASVGQVHRATWLDGTQVAVKLMYPGAREAVLNDLGQLRRASAPLGVLASATDVGAVVDAVAACVRDELDYRREAEHQQVFAGAYADDADFVVPRVIHRQGDVLVSEWVDGTPVSRLIASGGGFDRDRAARLMVRFVMTGFARTGLLYSDPHPGNFLVRRDGRLGVVDFGACSPFPPPGFLEPPGFAAVEADLLEAAFNGEARGLEDALRRHGFIAAGARGFDADALLEIFGPLREMWISPHLELSTSWLRDQALRAIDVRLAGVARQVAAPAELVPLGRAVLTLIGVLCQLQAGSSIRDEFLNQRPQLAEVVERFGRRQRRPTSRVVDIRDVRRANGPSSALSVGG